MGHKHFTILLLIIFVGLGFVKGQESDTSRVADYTKDQITQMTQEELLELSLEDLIMIVKKLKLSSIEELYQMVLNPVVESASKKEEGSFESPLSVSVITKEELTKAGPLNIPEALRLSPDIIVRQKTNGNYDVHIRGNDNVPPGEYLFDSENTITLVMIDNRPVYNNFQGGTFWEALPIAIEDIEKIEVVAGPATALYGPNAVTGAINIITTRPNSKKLSANAHVQYGNANTTKAHLSVNKNISDRLSARLSANYQHRDRFQDEYLYFVDYEYYPSDSLSNLVNESDTRYPDTELALDQQAVNAAVRYANQKKLTLDLSGGIQKSAIQTIYLDINNISLSRRESEMKYLDFQGKYKNLKAQVSYESGLQNNAVGYYGYKFDIDNLFTSLEYTFTKGILSVSPGVSYSESTFDDTPYLMNNNYNNGLFNRKVVLSDMAYYIRTELNPGKNLRLIGALRWDEYNLPNKQYFTYQFVASYSVGNNSHLRMVYSSANRGPFMYDYYVNHETISTNADGYTIYDQYSANEDLKLVKMDMVEFGFRHRVQENIVTDFSFFYNKARDFSITSTTIDTLGTDIFYETEPINSELISRQLGATIRFNYVASKSFQLHFFTTAQITMLENLYLEYGSSDSFTETIAIETDFIHESTPSMFGGLTLNYMPNDRLNTNINFYRYGKQEFFSIDGLNNIEAKTIMNMKIDYKFHKNHSIFFNARNFLDNHSYEFIFADEANGLYLIGLDINL